MLRLAFNEALHQLPRYGVIRKLAGDSLELLDRLPLPKVIVPILKKVEDFVEDRRLNEAKRRLATKGNDPRRTLLGLLELFLRFLCTAIGELAESLGAEDRLVNRVRLRGGIPRNRVVVEHLDLAVKLHVLASLPSC